MTASMILEHLSLVVAALIFAVLAGVPLGILCHFHQIQRFQIQFFHCLDHVIIHIDHLGVSDIFPDLFRFFLLPGRSSSEWWT